MRRLSTVAVLFAMATFPAIAADIDGDGLERILVPLAMKTHIVPGAHGTRWTGNLWLYNPTDRSVAIGGPWGCSFPGSCFYQSGHIGPFVNGPLTDHPEFGLMLQTDATIAADLTLSSRLWETSRLGQPRGIDLPIVREGNFFDGPVAFISVPTAPGARVSLRVYNPWAETRSPVIGAERLTVEVLTLDGTLLVTTDLLPVVPGHPVQRSDYPGFAALHNLVETFPVLATQEAVHIRITPAVAGAQFYAMVAVTDNDTQTVLIITAQ